jgi:parallel beta-helix repeat protein
MRRLTFVWLTLVPLVVVGTAGRARGEDISGTLSATKIIVEDSRLIGDVTCTMTDGPCIDFGAPGITLRLNGFTITGPGLPDNPPSAAMFCNATNGLPAADGIRISNQPDGQILGPGMVQKFRRHGILIVGTLGVATRIRVSDVTSHHNCFSGFMTNAMSESVIEGLVSVRNAVNSGTAPCGGNCVVNSHNNIIRRSVFAGNGSVANNNDDFGIGLIFGSSGNLIENNTVGGNTNGVLIQATATGNTIRRNIIAGNPPSQISRDYGTTIGADVRDESIAPASGERNTLQENWCVTYTGPGPSPCPNLTNQPVVVPVACATPAPVAGWVCVNGGWVPPDHPLAGTTAPPSPPPPSTVACATPAPVAGWVCVNGGWVPPDHPLAGTTSPLPPPLPAGGCPGSDPFAAIPGLVGQCVNGGWIPRPSGGGEE